MPNAKWYLMLSESIVDTRETPPNFHAVVPMQPHKESSDNIIGTLHRWPNDNGLDRECWAIEIKNGKPVLRRTL